MKQNDPNAHKGQRLGAAGHAKIAEMIKAGAYSIDIQRKFDTSSATISDVCRRYGIKCTPMPKDERLRRAMESRRLVEKPQSSDAAKHWRGLAYTYRWDHQW